MTVLELRNWTTCQKLEQMDSGTQREVIQKKLEPDTFKREAIGSAGRERKMRLLWLLLSYHTLMSHQCLLLAKLWHPTDKGAFEKFCPVKGIIYDSLCHILCEKLCEPSHVPSK